MHISRCLSLFLTIHVCTELRLQDRFASVSVFESERVASHSAWQDALRRAIIDKKDESHEIKSYDDLRVTHNVASRGTRSPVQSTRTNGPGQKDVRPTGKVAFRFDSGTSTSNIIHKSITKNGGKSNKTTSEKTILSRITVESIPLVRPDNTGDQYSDSVRHEPTEWGLLTKRRKPIRPFIYPASTNLTKCHPEDILKREMSSPYKLSTQIEFSSQTAQIEYLIANRPFKRYASFLHNTKDNGIYSTSA